MDPSTGAQEAQEAVVRRPLEFMDLPSEVQKEIVRHASQADLICLSLVSRHFRELAAAQLYRNFNIVFPDEDDPQYDSPIDGLAGGLDTFATSDYDYAQHLRDLSLDTLSAGYKAEEAYKPYLASLSCGKFMNTLLLLTLRKAKKLETFKWNIRVELSRPVYRELHRIESLSHLHIRLQEGPSIYEAPPPLPFHESPSPAIVTSPYQPNNTQHTVPNPNLPNPNLPFSQLLPPITNISQGQASGFYPIGTVIGLGNNGQSIVNMGNPPPQPKPPRPRPLKKVTFKNEPPTFSGFKELKSLSVLDIDSLDIITEIKSCVRNSAGTLSKVKLSFSDKLASQARKPPPELDPEDSDVDDEFQVPPPPLPAYMSEASGPAKAFRAQEERKTQEAVLGRIFDLEVFMVKKAQKKQREKEKGKEKETKPESSSKDPGQDFIRAIKMVAGRLVKELGDDSDPADVRAAQQGILDTIELAARKYLESRDEESTQMAGSSSSASASMKPSSSSPSAPTPSQSPTPTSEEAEGPKESASLFGDASSSKLTESQKSKGVVPEDINIEEPEEQLNLDASDPTAQASAASEPITIALQPTPSTMSPRSNAAIVPPEAKKAMVNLAAQRANFKTLAEKLDIFETQADALSKHIAEMRTSDSDVDISRIAEAEKEMSAISHNIQDIHKELLTVELEIGDAERQMPTSVPVDSLEIQNQRMIDYQRRTRGVALQSFSAYLIPVRASVLSRAIDLRVLRSLTLLNVGIQAPIWSHLTNLNRDLPLPLRKIFTDNVTPVFLSFVYELEKLEQLFMLERDAKYKPEPFTPKTTTTTDHIRKAVLKKHVHHLKRLMIKNHAGTAWDLDEKSILLLCSQGEQLEELSCSMSIRSLHTFMQRISGLINLRALHIVQLRNEDTCVWVMREAKRFLIDNLSHHPELKLEWVSIDEDDRVERLIRPTDLPERDKGMNKGKGKQKVVVVPGIEGWPNNIGASSTVMAPPPQSWELNSDSEDDDGQFRASKIETVGDLHFYDVYGVKIFKKEVIKGRL